MKSLWHKILTVALAVVFVNFVFSNTIYMHSHTGADGNPVTHSHPYLPSSGHSHSASGLDSVANFNFSAGAFVASAVQVLDSYSSTARSEFFCPVSNWVESSLTTISLRAPPVKM